ncbi:glutamine amidotransferase-related protein [Candidatus Carsonella ruddii]|uniref:carbamoyl-phosphate synthase (glutamine-hydrolyzing) n=1 Tax=Candidatus Carsonella ruddii (Diaphorina cf. continua) TaxID=2661587 RepID=A0A7R6VY99_CARRU|nr:hypothetical protein [Candidatus Carsonella ruddii (Diaphorina cf. continua)]BCG49298.1 split carbamoylphosphate synthase small subunit [Candidatus Carsonella ruddii (Diaphorina cf. continua)]
MINILLINFGCKLGMFKLLIKNNYFIYEFEKKINICLLLKLNGVFISNGPGAPKTYLKYFNIILFFVYIKIPILSICLGHQIISIINMFSIFKLKNGHHGVNHPIYNINKKKLYLTSQNHNFNIKKNNYFNYSNLFFSLFDNTLQNINSEIQPLICFQGHPEGCPGPNDLINIFKYYKNIYEQ